MFSEWGYGYRGRAAKYMIPESTSHAVTTRPINIVMVQGMPELALFQPVTLGTPMMDGVMRDRVSQVTD